MVTRLGKVLPQFGQNENLGGPVVTGLADVSFVPSSCLDCFLDRTAGFVFSLLRRLDLLRALKTIAMAMNKPTRITAAQNVMESGDGKNDPGTTTDGPDPPENRLVLDRVYVTEPMGVIGSVA